MASPDDVAKAFVEHYYNTWKTDRSQLGALYQDQSMLTWEGTKVQGGPAIIQKFQALPFQQIEFQTGCLDAQPSATGGIMIMVTGKLLTNGENHPMQFSQMFHLMPVGASFVVTNEVFRLVYG